jgi:dTDP-4-dehydrorhamnose reductase
MARIVVLGAGGRLGAALAREYAADHEVLAFGRTHADLAHPHAAAAIVAASAPDIVINCAAMTNVDACETERDLALTVNGDAPGAIARAARQAGARLIHISTDYVFSGDATEPYAEDAATEPVSWYGETKLRGEQAVQGEGDHHAVVRVAWVFGPDRDSFVDKALQASLRGEPVEAVADKWSSPSYALDLADALRPLFQSEAAGGIYHACNRGICTWLEWGQEAIDAAAAQGLNPRTISAKPLRLADIKAMVARRPVYSPMSCRRIEALLGRPLRPWRDAVRAYVQDRYGKRSEH